MKNIVTCENVAIEEMLRAAFCGTPVSRMLHCGYQTYIAV